MKNFYQTTDSYTFLPSGTTRLSEYDELWFQIHNAKTFEELPHEKQFFEAHESFEISDDQYCNLVETLVSKKLQIYDTQQR